MWHEPTGPHRSQCLPYPGGAGAAPRATCFLLAASSHRHGLGCWAGPAAPIQAGVMEHRIQQGSREGGPWRVPRRGMGRRGQNMSWTHVLHPGGSLSYPASVCLPRMGAGGRLWRQRGQAEARRRALQGAATCGWPPSNAAPGCGSGPAHTGSGEPEPVLRPVGMEEGRGRAGPWAPGLGGWPVLPAGSSSTRSRLQRPAASASGERPCVACRRSQ